MRYNDDLFKYTISELEKKGQYELALHFHHQRMREMVNQKREREQMKKEIVEEVLARISVTIEDTALKALNRALDKFA